MEEEIKGYVVGEWSDGLQKYNVVTSFKGTITSFTNTTIGIDNVPYSSYSPMMWLQVGDYCEFSLDEDRWILTGKKIASVNEL